MGMMDDTPLEEWAWIDVPGMTCGNGTPTGIAINRSDRSSNLALMFEGGGACWEVVTCYGIGIMPTSVHLDGFNEQTFAGVRPSYFDNTWAFQRDGTSMFADATWVFVPYCTGDLHAGTQTSLYEALGQQRTMHHVGAANVDAMLARIAAYEPSDVYALGISAGGYGVQLNWDRIANAFPSATTHIFADGSQLVAVESARWGAMVQRWAPRFPCANCTRLDEIAAYWRSNPPRGRYGLTASLQDQVLALYFGYDLASMRNASLAIASAMTGTQAAFMIDNTSHTMLAAPTTKTSTMIELRPWVEAWVDGTSAFTTVGP